MQCGIETASSKQRRISWARMPKLLLPLMDAALLAAAATERLQAARAKLAEFKVGVTLLADVLMCLWC